MSTTILGTCPICMENLSASIDPVVMPCGHLYCLGCATFIFFQGEEPQACSVCRKKFRGENIIKLFLNSDGSSRSQTVAGTSVGRESEAFTHDQDLVGACEDLLVKRDQDRDDASLAAALHRTEVYVNALSRGEHYPGIQNVLKNLRTVLSDIYATLQRKAQAQAQPSAPGSTSSATHEVSQLRARMELDIQELCREKILAEEAGARAQEDHGRREHDLRERLQDVRRALEIAKRNLEDAQHKVIGLTDDLNKSRKSELKYRKKYYALKQEVAAVKKNSRSGRHPPDEDDSLIVV